MIISTIYGSVGTDERSRNNIPRGYWTSCRQTMSPTTHKTEVRSPTAPGVVYYAHRCQKIAMYKSLEKWYWKVSLTCASRCHQFVCRQVVQLY